VKQILVGGYYDLLNISTTEYNSIGSGDYWDDDINQDTIVSTPGTLRNLRVELDDVPGTGTYTFTLRRAVGEGAPANTALTCTVAADGTTASDTEHDVTVAAGDVISLECNPDSPDNARYAKWTMEFEGDNANESLILQDARSWVGTSTQYKALGVGGYSSNASNVNSVCPTSGTIKNLYVKLQDDPGDSPEGYKFTLMKNGAPTDLTCTVTADDKSGNDTAHDVTVAAGDVLNIKCEPVNSPTVSTAFSSGLTFVADTDGESIIWGAVTNQNLLADSTGFYYLSAQSASTWSTTENQRQTWVQECVFKKLYVKLANSPGADKGYTFTIRQNGASPANGLAVEISGDTDTTGNDTTHTITISDGDDVGIMSVPSNTPTVGRVGWGLVCFIAPPPITGAATLAGVGSLTTSAITTLIGKATLSGAGTLIASAVATLIGKATLSGVGALAGIGRITAIGKATLSGVGTLSAAGRRILTGIATLSGTGVLSAAGSFLRFGQATLSGIGLLSGKGALIAIGKATLSGVGSLVAIGRRIFTGKVALTGAGSLASKGITTLIGKVTLAGIGNLSAIGRRIFTGKAVLAGVGTLVAKAIMTYGRILKILHISSFSTGLTIESKFKGG